MSRPLVAAVAFDYAGTLVTLDPRRRTPGTETSLLTLVPDLRSVSDPLRQLDSRVEAEVERGAAPPQAYALALEALGMPSDGATADAVHALCQDSWGPAAVLTDGAAAVLSFLERRGVPAILCSNAPYADAVLRQLLELGIGQRFAAIALSGLTGRRKPDPDLLLPALGTLGVDPAAALMVGDSAVDLELGRAAGTLTALLGLQGGDFLLTSLRDVMRLPVRYAGARRPR